MISLNAFRIELQVEKGPSSLVLYHFVGAESSISADPVVMTRRITFQVCHFMMLEYTYKSFQDTLDARF